MPRFDGYTATVQGVKPDDVFNLFWTHSDEVRAGRGFHRFEQRHAVVDQSGDEVGFVQHGGKAHAGLVMVEVKGERTPAFVDKFRQLVPTHRCTRVDSCQDFDEPGAWDRLLAHVLEVKQEHRLKGEKRGDWDFPEDGRTQYLGSDQSAVRARLYEKGKQPGYRHLERFDLARLEIQVRPVKAAKTVFSSLDALQVWGASPFTRDLAARILQLAVDKQAAGTVWKRSKPLAALGFACQQYGPAFLWLHDHVGDWQSVGLTLGEMIAEVQEKKRRGVL